MISLESVSLHFGNHKLFENISFLVSSKDRIGLVGKNGAGKSSLFKLIVKQLSPVTGKVTVPGDITIGYLPQEISCEDSHGLLDEVMSAFKELNHLDNEIEKLNKQLTERTDYESKEYLDLADRIAEKSERLNLENAATAVATAVKTLIGLGFTESDMKRHTSEFSGGWRMRVELAKILLRSPDIFLLDEPTNHLDIESIQWLENFLKQYHGAIILISHDRAFLNAVTKRTIEITLGNIHDYKVPYSKYVELREERRAQLMAAYRNQQKQIEDTREFIERFRYKATKAVQVQSRIKQLDKMEIIEIEEDDMASINIRFPDATRAGSLPFKLENLTKKYGDHVVIDNIDMQVERGDKIAFIGKNGEGKTTLSRVLVGELDYSGTFQKGHNVKIGYYAQNQDKLLDQELTVFETLDKVAVGDIRTKLRDILGAFLFSGEDVDKKVKVLSGGEKSRLAMAKLLLEPHNVLILDEPTNHLDMRSKDILKVALQRFKGTFIVVSHDREFLNDLTTKIYEFRNKKIHEFRGGIYEYLNKKKINTLDDLNIKSEPESHDSSIKSTSEQKELYIKRKEIDKEIRKVESKIKRLEENIEKAENEISEMGEMLTGGVNKDDHEFYNNYQKMRDKIELMLSDWEQLQNEIEILNAKRNSVI
ncbi:MAG: ATP-binding cassette domain-containing protein [Bacteroidales bacterium]|nr:ATP-binding cassette domain-containing protein [Bacteroidales bacterium]